MSAIPAKIAQILDGFRQNHAQYEETVSLLDSYLQTLPERDRDEFFQTLWIQYRSETISNLNPKRTVHALNRSETLHQLLDRLERALGPALEEQIYIDEINGP